MTYDKLEDLIAAWDNDDTISTIEMGGLGPGYEQAIESDRFILVNKEFPR